MLSELQEIEDRVLRGLKDFQVATARRVFELFTQGQDKVLVADEVGLGKTLIAKGVIAQCARHHFEKAGPGPFRIAYVCSNQVIARQNLSKLQVSGDTALDSLSTTRLSMQHLNIYEQENRGQEDRNHFQLISLTPGTSLQITSGGGHVKERALIYAVLKRTASLGQFFSDNLIALDEIFLGTATTAWPKEKRRLEARLEDCNKRSSGRYLEKILPGVEKHLADSSLVDELKRLIIDPADMWNVLGKLRTMFAEISIDLLTPDLVIMDEFQRFKSLLQIDDDNETNVLARRLFARDSVNVLMLSATPFKLYSTMDEIYESENGDEHYREFTRVMEFLLDPAKFREFERAWNDYSQQLRAINKGDCAIAEARERAQDAMYQAICRTERNSAHNELNLIDDSRARQAIKISEQDLMSYIQAERLAADIARVQSVPIDYIKSCPFLLSFCTNYKLHKNIKAHYEKHPQMISQARGKLLWVDGQAIAHHRELAPANARLEVLKEAAFENKAELLLWVPPSRPYYANQGVFAEARNFSKILVFSAWQMVPRMIAALISYENERKTVGKLLLANKGKKKSKHLASDSKPLPVARLRFNLEEERPQSMSLFCLLYPSQTLVEIYKPISYLNQNSTVLQIEAALSVQIETRLQSIRRYQKRYDRKDDRWYFLAPLLLDPVQYAENWLSKGEELISEGFDEDEDRQQKKTQRGFELHLETLAQYFHDPEAADLGHFPEDLVPILVRMAMASPAVCYSRSNPEITAQPTQFAKVLINMFNKPEATAAVELCYAKERGDAHWKNVLLYCKDGNLQAMLDEYIHILTESHGLSEDPGKSAGLHQLIIKSMQTHSASYKIDTYPSFRNKIRTGKGKEISLRSHYAVAFQKSEGESSKTANRKESIRNSFNSPFRPFVLATTSIGQEGLDFHYYCRKIMHWNLPSNPVDLEQREGRIDRFKSLAIRQNIAAKYSGLRDFEKDVWTEIFKKASLEYKGKYPELVPFWCLPDSHVVKIERIVPIYPFSQDISNYERLIKILSLYRLTLGQPNQEELLEHIFTHCENAGDLKKLFINLSPYDKASQ